MDYPTGTRPVAAAAQSTRDGDGFDVVQILKTVASLFPVARTLINILDQAKKSPAHEIMNLAEKITPIALQFISSMESIKTQTEKQHPEVWATIRDDWKSTYAKAKELGLA